MEAADWAHGTALAIHFTAGPVGTAWLLLANAGAEPVSFTLPAGAWQPRLASDPQQDPSANAPRLQAAEMQLMRTGLMMLSA